MKELMKSKKVWAALAGLAIAFGALFTAVGDAQADAGTPGFTPYYTKYALKCGPSYDFGAKVELGIYDDGNDDVIAMRLGLVNTGTPVDCEIWQYVKEDQNDPDTWYYGKVLDSGYNNSWEWYWALPNADETPIWSGTLDNSAIHMLTCQETITFPLGLIFDPTDQMFIVVDFDVDGEVDVDANLLIFDPFEFY